MGEAGVLLATRGGSPYHATIEVLVFTGTRLSEGLGLQWQQIATERERYGGGWGSRLRDRTDDERQASWEVV